jgi:hypothetical protein
MGVLKDVTNIIESWLIGDDRINEVTKGDSNEIDITAQTNFALAHIIYNTTSYSDGYTTLNYNIQLLDTFFENVDDKLDVLDKMNEVASQFSSAVHQGSLFNSQIRALVDPTGTIIYDQLQNRLYGISINISLQVPSGIINCG